MTLGQRISQHRKTLGISQEELGGRLGVSRQAVSKWETDAAAPDMNNLMALAREFNISVAELTETPPSAGKPHRRFLWPVLCGCLAAALAVVPLVFLTRDRASVQSSEKPANMEQTVSTPSPASDFALIWTSRGGTEEFLELGVQDSFFPFGTSLELTEPEDIFDTDLSIVKGHRADCGAITIGYSHIEEDLELDPESPEQEVITCLSTIAAGVRTPRDIHAGSTKAEVAAAYGDDLVYCLKEPDGYTLVQHDYYYAYQTRETFGASLQIFMRDGAVAGIRVEDMAEWGNEAFLPNNISRFPLIDGEPDFSLREEPEREERGDTWEVYHAWNQLVTNNNLSAEEIYTYRWIIFSTLSDLDWQELGQYGATEYPAQTIEALFSWLLDQAPYSEAETFQLLLGCTAKGLDGAYTDMYCHLLSTAFFRNPIAFAKGLAYDGLGDIMYHAIRFTAYDAELYPTELKTALDTLEAAIDSGGFTEAEADWAKLLRLYLITPIDDRNELPQTPADMT